MILIVCLSENEGLAFNDRRQSRDAVLSEDILKTAAGGRLYMSPYSRTIFPEDAGIIFDDDFLSLAGEGDYCFYEKGRLAPAEGKVEKLIVYRWNRDYPADEYFQMEEGFALEESTEFEGKSHPRITKEVWGK